MEPDAIDPNRLLAAILAVVGCIDAIIGRFFVANLMTKNPNITPNSIRNARLTLYAAAVIMLALAFYFYHLAALAAPH